MNNKLIRLIALTMSLVMLCALFTGCTPKQEDTPAEPRTVVDMTGETITLPETVDRVFVDWASGITLITTLGATDKLVVVPTAFETDTFAWTAIICPAINDVEKTDTPFTNVEVALSYEPDVVITSTKDNIEIYQNLGLTVIYVKFNDNASFKESLKIVGAAIGDEAYAAAVKYGEYFDDNVAMVTERLSGVAEAHKPTVYYMDSRFGDCVHTVGTGEIQEDWINVAGGILATAAEFSGRNLEINPEKLLELNPDIIIIGAQQQAEIYDMLLADPVLSTLDAVKNGSVYRAPQGLFPWCRTGPEAAIQMIWAAKLLYPAEFEDVDIKAVAHEFYSEFYGADVSDADLEGILAGKLSPNGK